VLQLKHPSRDCARIGEIARVLHRR